MLILVILVVSAWLLVERRDRRLRMRPLGTTSLDGVARAVDGARRETSRLRL